MNNCPIISCLVKKAPLMPITRAAVALAIGYGVTLTAVPLVSYAEAVPWPLEKPAAATKPVVKKLDPVYLAKTTPQGVELHNPAQQMVASFNNLGVSMQMGKDSLGFELQAFGHGTNSDQLVRVAPIAPVATAETVNYNHPGMTVWYKNSAVGIEQGFTLDKPPTGQGTGPLSLAVRLSGTLAPRAHVDNKGMALTFTDSIVSYVGLMALDADGKKVPAKLALSGDTLLISVDDADARYPLTIDPMVQKTELSASDGVAQD